MDWMQGITYWSNKALIIIYLGPEYGCNFILTFCYVLGVSFEFKEGFLLIDFSDKISRSRRTGYDVDKTEYEMV